MSDRAYTVAGLIGLVGLPILAAADSFTLPLGVAVAGLVAWWLVFNRDKGK